MKIGILGGAFNPVHKGHLHMLEEHIYRRELDKVIIIPTATPPHKTADDLISAEDRINMLNLAIKNRDNFCYDIVDKLEISDMEFKRQGKSYTYDTLCELKKIYPNDELFLLIGGDQFLYFKKWYKYKEILEMAELSIVAREGNQINELLSFADENSEDFLGKYSIAICPAFEVSSTEIRKKVKNGESISDLVPKEVENYILEKELYRV